MNEPANFAVNVHSKKESIELQKLAFSYGYKWKTDTDYNNIDEHMMQYYGKHTCMIFMYMCNSINFCKLLEVHKFSEQMFLLSYKNDYRTIVENFEYYKSYWAKKEEDELFKNSLFESNIKERIIL